MLPSGRGSAMQRFLAAMQEQKQTSDERPEQSPPVRQVGRGKAMILQDSPLEEGMEGLTIAGPRGPGGRGRSMPTLAPSEPGRASSRQPSQEEARTGTEFGDVPRAVGRGRSALLLAFVAQQSAAEKLPVVGKGPGEIRPKRSLESQGKLPLQHSKQSIHSPEQVQSTDITKESYSETPMIRKGSSGQSVDVVCNYINLDVKPGKGLFEYSLVFCPSEDNISMKTRMINQHLDQLGGVKSYNGYKLLLSIQLNKETTFQCQHPATERPVEMTLICKGQASERDAADVYNMLFRRIMVHLGLKNMGRKFFDPSGAVSIPQHRLEVWPGYVTAVQQFEGGIQLCCDASHRVLRTESVLDVLSNMVKANPQRYREESLKILLGAVVLTRYNNRVYRIDDVAWDKSPESTFTDSSGSEISFCQYYENSYKIDIRDKRQPLLISRVDRKKDPFNKEAQKEVRMICLIPELCFITGLSDAMRADFRIMKDLTSKLQLTPAQRHEGLCKFLENIKRNEPSLELLSKWGLRVASLPVKLTARVVDPEVLLYNDTRTQLDRGIASWTVNNTLLVPKDLQRWAILHVPQDSRVAQEFESQMRRMTAQMGMKVYAGKFVKVLDNRNENFLDALRSTIVPDLQLVVVFFPTLRSDRYAAVKKLCCVERPVSSQVIQSRTLSRPEKAKSIIKKIAMQINCKLGGALWGVNIPFTKLMICGMDVYHSAGTKGPSVMGFVATSDPLQKTWFSKVGFGGNFQEIADNLRGCIGGALMKYREVSGFYPERIIVFRDGVGDSQLNMTREFEVPQLLQSFCDINPNYKPKLTVVVCQKRIMTRLLSVQGDSAHKFRVNNPLPGTVMDHTITKFDAYDFFLVSQSSGRGTVSPTHYIVAYDDGQIKPDHVQRMTYKMTHLYYNWTGTISVPAPAQYAHRLAQLVGQHLHKHPSAELSDKLFFL